MCCWGMSSSTTLASADTVDDRTEDIADDCMEDKREHTHRTRDHDDRLKVGGRVPMDI